jgi:hypothetical protein
MNDWPVMAKNDQLLRQCRWKQQFGDIGDHCKQTQEHMVMKYWWNGINCTVILKPMVWEISGKYNPQWVGHSLFYTVICQRIDRQRLDKHTVIRAHNSRTNVYSSLLGNSQRANGLER